MTLLETIQLIERIAQAQPCVNEVVRDSVLRLNETPANRYGAFVWTQGQHSASLATDVQTFRFTFFYVDRVTETRDNVPAVQSVGVDCLGNIIRTLAEALEVDTLDWTIDTFTQRFTDDCAGAYATISLPVAVSYACPEGYESNSTWAESGGILKRN